MIVQSYNKFEMRCGDGYRMGGGEKFINLSVFFSGLFLNFLNRVRI